MRRSEGEQKRSLERDSKNQSCYQGAASHCEAQSGLGPAMRANEALEPVNRAEGCKPDRQRDRDAKDVSHVKTPGSQAGPKPSSATAAV